MHRCTISHIDPDSPLRHAAHPGDRLVSINGNPITDVLDYKYYAYDPELAPCALRPPRTGQSTPCTFPSPSAVSWGWTLRPTSWTTLTRAPTTACSASSIRCRRACADAVFQG